MLVIGLLCVSLSIGGKKKMDEKEEEELVAEALELIDGGFYGDAVNLLNEIVDRQWRDQLRDMSERLYELENK